MDLDEFKALFLRSGIGILLVTLLFYFHTKANPYSFPGLMAKLYFIDTIILIGLFLLYVPYERIFRKIIPISLSIYQTLKNRIIIKRPHTHRLRSISHRSGLIYFIKERISRLLPAKKRQLSFFHNITRLDFIKGSIKYLFLVSLLVITVGQLSIFDLKVIIKPYTTYISIFAILCGALTFYWNRGVVDKIEQENIAENKKESNRYKEFPKRYPKLQSIPILNRLFRWMYKEGWWYILALLLIIVIFTSLRATSFDNSWDETPNFGKVRSEIPSAIKAYQKGDIFYDENNFYGTVENYGVRNYNKLPFYQWILYPFVGLSETIPFLLSIKLVLLLIDIFILIQLYFLFCKFFKKKFALIGLFLISINIFFQYYFATPVEDRFALLFFLIGANYLISGKDYKSYLFGGLSFLAKESFFLIIIPFYGLIEFFRLKNDFKVNLNRLIKNTPLILTPYLLFNLFIKKLPVLSTWQRIIFILITISIFTALYYFSKSKYSIFKASKKTNLISGSLLGSIVVGSVYLLLKKAQALDTGFLTNMDIIFNWSMYDILIRQFVSFFGDFLWSFLVLGIIILLIKPNENKLIICLFASAITYFIIASKAIAFHQYYRHIFVILFVVLIVLVLRQIYYCFLNKKIASIFIIIIILLISHTCYDLTDNKIKQLDNKEDIIGLEEASYYLKSNISEGTNIISNNYKLYSVTIFSSFHDPCLLNKKHMRELVDEIGFENALKKYNCTYFISAEPSDFSNFLNIFTNISSTEVPSRTEMILYRTQKEITEKYHFKESFDSRSKLSKTTYYTDPKEALEKYKPSQYFTLEKVIGDIHIYRLNSTD